MKNLLATGLWVSLMMSTTTGQAEPHSHGAHVHGSATLNIAFDNTSGKIEFKSAGESIVGFERMPRADKDKKALNAANQRFEKNISKMIQFDASLGCEFKKEKADMVAQDEKSNHADYIGEFTVTCKKPVLGSTLKLDFSGYAKLKDVDVTILAGDLQKTVELQGKPVSIDLK